MCRSTEVCTFLSGVLQGWFASNWVNISKAELSTKAQYSPLSICLYKMINTFSKVNFKISTFNYLLLYQDKIQNSFFISQVIIFREISSYFHINRKKSMETWCTTYSLYKCRAVNINWKMHKDMFLEVAEGKHGRLDFTDRFQKIVQSDSQVC